MATSSTQISYCQSAYLLKQAVTLSQMGQTSAEIRAARSAAVLYSMLSLEAFLNDVIDLFKNAYIGVSLPDRLNAAAEMLQQMEVQRTATDSKFSLLAYVLCGVFPSKGKPPFQDLKVLIELRNHMAHPRPGSVTMTLKTTKKNGNLGLSVSHKSREKDEKLVEALKRACKLNQPVWPGDWRVIAESSECAAWAVEVAHEVIRTFLGVISDDCVRLAWFDEVEKAELNPEGFRKL